MGEFDPAAAFQRIKALKKKGKEDTEEFRKLHRRLKLHGKILRRALD